MNCGALVMWIGCNYSEDSHLFHPTRLGTIISKSVEKQGKKDEKVMCEVLFADTGKIVRVSRDELELVNYPTDY